MSTLFMILLLVGGFSIGVFIAVLAIALLGKYFIRLPW